MEIEYCHDDESYQWEPAELLPASTAYAYNQQDQPCVMIIASEQANPEDADASFYLVNIATGTMISDQPYQKNELARYLTEHHYVPVTTNLQVHLTN